MTALDGEALVLIGDVRTWLRGVELQVERYAGSFERSLDSFTLPQPKPPVFDHWVDGHLLAVTAWQLCEAVRLAAERRPDLGLSAVPVALRDRVKTARDHREHWHEYRWPSGGKRGRAGEAYAERYPEASPGQLAHSIGRDGGHHTLYGILSVDDLRAEAERIRRQLAPHVTELAERAAREAVAQGWDRVPEHLEPPTDDSWRMRSWGKSALRAMADPELRGFDKQVFAMVVEMARIGGETHVAAGAATIASQLGAGLGAVKRSMRQLRTRRYLQLVAQGLGHGRANVYSPGPGPIAP